MQYYYFYIQHNLIEIEPINEPFIYENNNFNIIENYCVYYISKFKVISIKNIPFIDYDFDKYINIRNTYILTSKIYYFEINSIYDMIEYTDDIESIECYRYPEIAISKGLIIDTFTDYIKNSYKLKGCGIFKYYSDCGNLFCEFFHNDNKTISPL